jgi:glutamyl-tRNA(Gln) amidotransferase subunit E
LLEDSNGLSKKISESLMEKRETVFSKRAISVGLEIHQQLQTKTKLFCHCPVLDASKVSGEFQRTLRAATSELGTVDEAARFESKRASTVKYRFDENSSCLLEADEEPPSDISSEALDSALIVSLQLGAQILDEVHVMRKIVIDGSNTSGFQRTAVVALGGKIKTDSMDVKVQTVTVEEDAARAITERTQAKTFLLDRLGVPLVEIALAPISVEPCKVPSVALAVGRMLRASGRVARGLGTIRQDVNVSISGSPVLEIKGVQKLEQIQSVLEYEIRRHDGLEEIANEINRRKIRPRIECVKEISYLLENTRAKIIIDSMASGRRVFGARIPGMKGILGYEPVHGIRLGRELAEVARSFGLGGILHSDEDLRSYGLTEKEVEVISADLQTESQDAFIILSCDSQVAKFVIQALEHRLAQSPLGLVAETRGPTDSGETRFLRPRPGSARMYPETDIPPIPISAERIARLKKLVPEPWEQQVGKVSKEYNISLVLAEKLIDKGQKEIFEQIVSETKLPPNLVATILTEFLVEIGRKGGDLFKLNEGVLKDAFNAVARGQIGKEGLQLVLLEISLGRKSDVAQAISSLDLELLSDKDLADVIHDVVQSRISFVKERGNASYGPLMGEVMERVGGRADGAKVAKLLQEELKKILWN